MKITVFTSNQPRHLALIDRLASISHKTYAVIEVPKPQVRPAVLVEYFSHVSRAEKAVFGSSFIQPSNVTKLEIPAGSLNTTPLKSFRGALESDVFISFGPSFIKGQLFCFLKNKKVYNLHMGVSPYYRGSACNFWALSDKRFDMVGATIHQLTSGIDAGPIFFHAFPKPSMMDGFTLGMRAVEAGQFGLVLHLKNGTFGMPSPTPQSREMQMRYCRIDSFTAEIAQTYLDNPISPAEIYRQMNSRQQDIYVNPFIFDPHDHRLSVGLNDVPVGAK